MQPSESPRNIERASKTVSCSHPFEEGVLQIQIALSKAGSWWEGGNTSSVDLLRTMESHGITQIKAKYKQAHSLYKDTQTATCPSHFLSFLLFSFLFFLSFICTQAVTHCYRHSGSLPHALLFVFPKNIIITGKFLGQLVQRPNTGADLRRMPIFVEDDNPFLRRFNHRYVDKISKKECIYTDHFLLSDIRVVFSLASSITIRSMYCHEIL